MTTYKILQVCVSFDQDSFTLKRPFFAKGNCSQTCANAVINFLVYCHREMFQLARKMLVNTFEIEMSRAMSAGACLRRSMRSRDTWTLVTASQNSSKNIRLKLIKYLFNIFQPKSSSEVQLQRITEFPINQDKCWNKQASSRLPYKTSQNTNPPVFKHFYIQENYPNFRNSFSLKQ